MKSIIKTFFLLAILNIPINRVYCEEQSNSISIGLHKTFWTNGDTPGFLLKTDFQHSINKIYGFQLGFGFSRASDLKPLNERKFGELPGFFYIREHVLVEASIFRSFYLNDLDNSIFNIFLSSFYLSVNDLQNIGVAVNKITDEVIIENNYININVYGLGLILDYKFDFYKNTKIGPNIGWRWLFDQGNMVWSFGIKLLVDI